MHKDLMRRTSATIERSGKAYSTFIERLIRIPTINPPGANYERISALLAKKCRTLGFSTRCIYVPKKVLAREGVCGTAPRIAVVADWKPLASKTLHFNGHYDVVPAADKEQWRFPPFAGITQAGKIYGRGSEDMKATIASMLFAAEALRTSGFTPSINIQFSFTPDEETGGKTGLKYLIDKKLVRATWAVGEGYAGEWIASANKGVIWAIVSVRGRSAHASQPYRGMNAFEAASELACDFMRLSRALKARKSLFVTKEKRDLFPTHVTGGSLKGGNKVNVVPCEVSFSIDRRVLPEEDTARAKKQIARVVERFRKKHRDYAVDIDFFAQEEPVATDPHGLFARVFKDAVAMATGRKARCALMPGATDLRFFMRQGIPSLGYSVMGGERAHAKDEFVSLASVIKTTKVFAYLMWALGSSR